MQPLTTIHVSTERGWHGGEEQARLLVQGLAARGHRCVIFARAGGAFAERLECEGFQVLRVAGNGRGPKALWQARRWLRVLQPDVLHCHDSHALGGAGLAAWRLPIPARVVARRVDFPIRSAWRYRRLADRVITVSDAVADVCRASGLDSSALRVVHDGVDPCRGRSGDRRRGRESLALSDDQPLLLCVATLTDHKGHTSLLQAMPKVLAQIPEARLVLAGDGELREPLEAQARCLKITDAVKFLGYRHDVPDLLQAADLFVMPSHLEGLCSTLIDAMFARVPIVATTAGGIPEVLGCNPAGDLPVAMLVPPRDSTALANAMINALTNLPTLREMADRAELRAEKQFTAQRMVEDTLAVYREVLTGARSKWMNRVTRTRAA